MASKSDDKMNKDKQKSDAQKDKPQAKNEAEKSADKKDMMARLEEIYRTLHRHSIVA